MLRPSTSLASPAALLVALLVGLGATPALAQTPTACLTPGSVVTQSTLKFKTAAPGNIVATGNTLGLSKQSQQNGPGTLDSIGTFIALDPGSVDDSPVNGGNPWFAGTTSDWEANGSSAVLELPNEVEILHAELVWGGSWADPNGANSIEAELEDSVLLIAGADEFAYPPVGPGITITSGTLYRYYARSANVTGLVQTHGAGEYTVAHVPGMDSANIDSLHTAGWTLFVAYRDQAQPIRDLSIFFGGEFVDENTTQDYAFSDFCASSAGDLQGRAIITALEGDANRDGDVLCIAPGSAPANDDFVGLSGPNNPEDNFFASQINDANGDLDQSGTFGDLNHDAASVVNVSGGRQGWDITQVALSSADGSLAPGQTGAVIRTATLDDSYLPMAAGFVVDVVAPTFAPGPGSSSSVDQPVVEIGNLVTVTVSLTNDGQVAADNLRFTMSVPGGVSLIGFTTDGADGDIGGDPVQEADLGSGVDEGSLAPGDQRTVTATFLVEGAPDGGAASFFFLPSWAYEWEMCGGEPPLSEEFTGQLASTAFLGGGVSSSASGGGEGGNSGVGGSGSGGDPGAGGGVASSASGAATTAASGSSGAATTGSASAAATTGTQGAGSGGNDGNGDGNGDGDGDGGSTASDGAGVVTESEGCGCATPGAAASRSGADLSWPLAALALVTAGWTRRRRARG